MHTVLYDNLGTGPSFILAKVNADAIASNPGVGYGLVEDFDAFGQTVAVTSNVGYYAGKSGAWKSYEDNSCAITPQATVNGEIVIATTTSDNVEVWLQSGASAAAPFVISDTSGSDKKLVFEARVKTSTATNSKFGFFVGLAEEGLAAADTIADDGTLASKDLIGFFRPEGDGDGIDFVYQKAGQALQTIVADITVAADTYLKLGFVYDPAAPAAKRIAVYVDGVEQSTYVTATNIAAATFPDGEELGVLIGGKNATNVQYTLAADWLYAFQERYQS